MTFHGMPKWPDGAGDGTAPPSTADDCSKPLTPVSRRKAIVINAFVVITMVTLWLVLLATGGVPVKSLATAGLLIGGPFAVIAAASNPDWFFAHRMARPWVDRFGRRGARQLYFLLGFVLTLVGIWSLVSGIYSVRPDFFESRPPVLLERQNFNRPKP